MVLQLETVSASMGALGGLHDMLPSNLVYAIQRFVRDNAIITTREIDGKIEHHCCDRCLKAHALKVACDLQVDSQIKEYIESLLPGETGHDGYYLNEEELVILE